MPFSFLVLPDNSTAGEAKLAALSFRGFGLMESFLAGCDGSPATYFNGTLKPLPVRSSGKSVPPEVSANFPLDRFANGERSPRLGGFEARAVKVAMGVTDEPKKGTKTMTNSNSNPAAKAPSHVAYQVRDREGQKGFWTRIGSAWPHGDGQGFNIQLECVPLDGRITLRIASDNKD